MNFNILTQLATIGAEKFKILSAFFIYINYNAIIFYQEISEKVSDVSIIDLLSIERVGSTGLLLVAIWWTVREMKQKEKVFLEQIEVLREEHKKRVEEKEKRIEELILKLIEQKKAD